MPRTRSWPYTGWISTACRSWAVRGPLRRSSSVATPSLPTSCRIPAKRSVRSRSGSIPSWRAISTEARPTRSLWPRVYASLISTACTSAWTVAWWASRSRCPWASTQAEMESGSRASSAANAPYGPCQSTATISPPAACTRTGRPRAAVASRSSTAGGRRSASASIRPTSTPLSRQNTATAANAGGRAPGKLTPSSRRGPPSRWKAQAAAKAESASWAAFQTRRGVLGAAAGQESAAGTATRAAAAGGSIRSPAKSTGKKAPAPAPAGGGGESGRRPGLPAHSRPSRRAQGVGTPWASDSQQECRKASSPSLGQSTGPPSQCARPAATEPGSRGRARQQAISGRVRAGRATR